MAAIAKICTQCELSLNTAWFRSEPRTNKGLQSVCKMCESLWKTAHYEDPSLLKRKHESDAEYRKKVEKINLDPTVTVAEKKCHQCREIKPSSEFAVAIGRVGRLRADCKTCNNSRVGQVVVGLKAKVFDLLGHACKRCGFSDKRALQIDHVFGGGNKEHAVIKNYAKFLRWVIERADTGEYQMLCANCNWIKRSERNENPIEPRPCRLVVPASV